MGHRNYWNAPRRIVLGAITWLALPQPFLMAQESVKLTEQLIAPVVKPWQNVHTPTRNLVELVLPAPGVPHGPRARVLITTETRSDHSAALRRLQEIAAEQAGQAGYIDVCGWPALERRSLVELKHPIADERPRESIHSELSKTTVVTVAVAAGDFIVRYEGTLRPDVPVAVAEQIVALARKLQCSAKRPAGQTQRELRMLKRTQLKLRNSPGSSSSAGPSPQAPSLLVPGHGELQIAVSNDGKHVFVGTNISETSDRFSKDGGVTFGLTTTKWGFVDTSDPSVGVGPTDHFYLSKMGIKPPVSCTASVALSIDGGNNFSFAGDAAVCPWTGNNVCSPDQPQMAVDRKNEAAGGDQLYMVWRNFEPMLFSSVPNCNALNNGTSAPVISCSQDSGKTWGLRTSVGTGDVGRVTVGGDGSVYVTFISSGNLMINKFSSCASGLQQKPDFPRVIAAMNGVFCPVPGLDRCTPETEASPQPAVDDTDPQHVLVAYANNDGNPNENVIVRGSRNGGHDWTESVNMNSKVNARRFLPWICVTEGVAYVTWYDRSVATQKNPDWTAYFLNTGTGQPLKAGNERNVSQASDPQCASGWPGSADTMSAVNGCPAGTKPIPGVCKNGFGSGSLNACTSSAPACPNLESCQAVGAGGSAKYGDYNGNACSRGGVYVAWASGMPPPNVGGPLGALSIYTDRLNYASCGQQNQACCFEGSQCNSASLVCQNHDNTCVSCGGLDQPCCTQGPRCQANLACNPQNQCAPAGPCGGGLVNACGGCNEQHFPNPGTACKEANRCGRFRCSGTDGVTCDTSQSSQDNGCGGCTPLPLPGTGVGRGDSCFDKNGRDGILVCAKGGDSLVCCPLGTAGPGCGPN
jgi:hypothetical protein